MKNFELIVKALAKNFNETFSFLMELADMFSGRGDFEKAFLIREELLRQGVSEEQRVKILEHFASDFHKAGMYENALNVLKEAFVICSEKDRLLDYMSHLCIELNDWENLLNYQRMKKNKDSNFIVYGLCQWSKSLLDNNEYKKAKLLLKEAELIDSDSLHIKFHYADFFIYDRDKDGLLRLGEEISNNFPVFFGIFLKKYFSGFGCDDAVSELAENHLTKNRDDFYTLHILVKRHIEDGNYQSAYNFLTKYYKPSDRNPYLLKSYIQCVKQLGLEINCDYLTWYFMEREDVERWFRCSSCGYESEHFSFLCIRCNKFDVMTQIKFHEQQ